MPNTQHGFAQREMSRCGWSEGKGLGKTESGMKDAIKVKLKNNTGGLGHNEGTQFTFHWWDHIFNKAANSFKVSEGEEGDLIEKCEGKKITPVLISNKKPLSSKYANASLLYGTFVKAGTYQSDNKELSDCVTEFDSSDDSSDDDDEKLSVNDTLEKTFKKTGLTGHKAARHGFNLCGKLQRLENQEQTQLPSSAVNVNINKSTLNEIPENENEKSKINNDKSNSKSGGSLPKESNIEVPNDCSKKKKKKKEKKDNELEDLSQTKKICESNNKMEISNKRKYSEQLPELDEKNTTETSIETSSDQIPKKKKKKKNKDASINTEETSLLKDENSICNLSNTVDKATIEVENQPKKKKKKKKDKSIE